MSASEEWDMLIIPAIAPEDQTYRIGPHPHDIHRRRKDEVLLPQREPRAVLDEMRTAIGSMTFSAQYQQDPVPPGGNVIQRAWIQRFLIEPKHFDQLVCSWDTASTIGEASSYSVGMLWGQCGQDYYVLDLVRGRWETPKLRRLILSCQRDWNPVVTLIEDTELGRSLQQDIWATDRIRLHLRRPRYDKRARLEAQSSRFEAGRVHIADGKEWTEPYIDELLAFPFGRSNDQVDATSQALDYLVTSAARRAPLRRRNVARREIERRDSEEHESQSVRGVRDDDEEQPLRYRGPGSIPFGWPHR